MGINFRGLGHNLRNRKKVIGIRYLFFALKFLTHAEKYDSRSVSRLINNEFVRPLLSRKDNNRVLLAPLLQNSRLYDPAGFILRENKLTYFT